MHRKRQEVFDREDDSGRGGPARLKPLVAVVGGFLGAGKTTLILKAVRVLQARGVRVAAVMNDQGDDLVDTELARRSGVAADQVGGGCFCCRFPHLVEALERLALYHPQIIFAEAVGSCVDLVATTLRPLLRDYSGSYRVGPLTVLVHERPNEPELRFLFEQQVAEADLIVDRCVDVTDWIETLQAEGTHVGTATISVDYTRYADAEAALGWLNTRVMVRPEPAAAPAMILGPVLDEINFAATAAGIRIVHLKAIVQCESGYVKAAVTGNDQDPVVEGVLDASPAAEHEVLINLRALGHPQQLKQIVEQALGTLPVTSRAMQAFRPAVPVPYERV